MDDLISRQAALEALRDAQNHAFNSYHQGLIRAQKIIADLPSVKRKKGKWLRSYIKGIPHCCSVCAGRFDYEWKFCPNCGADMRGEKIDETN